MRKLVTIEKIQDIQPIEGADLIAKAKVKEWWVVIRKDEFKIGDKALYFEIDSLLPVKPEYEFLLRGSTPKKMLVDGKEIEGIRLKTIKLRGQISQGLAMPTSDSREVGTDVTEELEVIKYEPPISPDIAGIVKGLFPSFISKTDEERIQNCSEILENNKGETCYVTSKLDGVSTTFYKNKSEFGACTRKLELKEDPNNTLWKMVEKYDLKNVVPEGFAIQCELMGEGIQKNTLKLKGHKLFVYNLFNIMEQKYLDYDVLVEFVKENNLDMVPVIDDNFVLNHSCEDLLKLAVAKSPINPDVLQEGIVIRPLKEKNTSISGVLDRFSFKVISNEYLLKVEK